MLDRISFLEAPAISAKALTNFDPWIQNLFFLVFTGKRVFEGSVSLIGKVRSCETEFTVPSGSGERPSSHPAYLVKPKGKKRKSYFTYLPSSFSSSGNGIGKPTDRWMSLPNSRIKRRKNRFETDRRREAEVTVSSSFLTVPSGTGVIDHYINRS